MKMLKGENMKKLAMSLVVSLMLVFNLIACNLLDQEKETKVLKPISDYDIYCITKDLNKTKDRIEKMDASYIYRFDDLQMKAFSTKLDENEELLQRIEKMYKDWRNATTEFQRKVSHLLLKGLLSKLEQNTFEIEILLKEIDTFSNKFRN